MLYGMADNSVIIPAKRDGALYNFFLGNQDYVFKGIGQEFTVTHSSTSFLVTLKDGEGVVCGRHVTEVTENGANSMIQLNANSNGYVVIRVDLSKPAGTEAFLYSTPTLVQEDLNNSGYVHDLPLYRYVTNENGVSSFTDVRPLSGGSNVLCTLDNGNLYVEKWTNGVKTRKQVGSLDPESLTATPSDVKSGVTFGGSGSDTAQTGTFTAQTKTVTAGTTTTAVSADNGKYLTSVTVNPTPTQSKTVNPATSAFTVYPDSGKYLSSVTVNAYPVPSKYYFEAHTKDTGTAYSAEQTVKAGAKWLYMVIHNGTAELQVYNGSSWVTYVAYSSDGDGGHFANAFTIKTQNLNDNYTRFRLKFSSYNNGWTGTSIAVIVA